MTASTRQPVLPSFRESRTGADLDQLTVTAGGQAPGRADYLPLGSQVIAGLQRDGATRVPGLAIDHRGGVAVVTLWGELDISGACVLQAYLSDIRRQARARSVADLTGLAFIDCACLGVLVRHCKEIRRRGGSFALAGPQPGVHRILAITGLLTWFVVHGTVEEAARYAAAR